MLQAWISGFMYGGQGKMPPSNSKIKLRKKDNPGALKDSIKWPIFVLLVAMGLTEARPMKRIEALELDGSPPNI